MSRPAGCFCALTLFFVLAVVARAYSEEKAVLVTEDIQLKIADAFMGDGEYYRAVTEYKRFLILFPDSERADYALFKMGYAYYKGEEYASAARSFAALQEKYPDSVNAHEAQFLEGFSYWKVKQYQKASSRFESLADRYPESVYSPGALAARSLVAIDEDKPGAGLEVLTLFLEKYPEHLHVSNVREALKLVESYQELPQKSPALAGIMSAIIPGSGYMYAGRYGDGATAFLINGLFIAGTVIGVNEENYPVAAIVGGIGLPFYFGNIYGSANAAKKWNREVKEDLRAKIHVALSPFFRKQ